MAIDKLQEKIRKMKNPSVLDFSVDMSAIAPHILEQEGSSMLAYERVCLEVMNALKAIVPAVRFGLGHFSLLGADGLHLLSKLTGHAKELGYYVLLEAHESYSPSGAEVSASALLGAACNYAFDGLIVSAYAGSDVLKPYVQRLKDTGKDLFVVLRTANKSAAELQDLLTGSRLVHMAAADVVNRYADALVGRSGYSQVAAIGPASVADVLKKLRAKYKNMFLLVDGYDYSNANAKNCSYAFDALGHGAIVCSGRGILGAWDTDYYNGEDYLKPVVEAAERMKKNLCRYTTVL